MTDPKTRGPEPDTGSGTDGSAGLRAASRPRRSRWTVVMAALTLVLAALTTLDVALFLGGDDPAARRRGPALATAERVAVGLSSLGAGTAEAQLATLSDLATGSLRAELDGYRGYLQAVLDDAQVAADPRIGAAGLEQIDDDSAIALVAVTATVRTGAAPDAEERQYRLAVELQHEAGRWLASSVRYVP
jgi:Mce-associated membrane protein